MGVPSQHGVKALHLVLLSHGGEGSILTSLEGGRATRLQHMRAIEVVSKSLLLKRVLCVSLSIASICYTCPFWPPVLCEGASVHKHAYC